MSSWSEAFLEVLRGNPTISNVEAAEAISVEPRLLEMRLKARKDVAQAARAIRIEHSAKLHLERIAAEEDKTGRKSAAPEQDLPWELERFLVVYGELRDRTAAIRQMRGEGFPISWSDIKAGLKAYPGFQDAFLSIVEEDVVEFEDRLRESAKAGKSWAVRMALQAEDPRKYGNKVRVDVHQHAELTAGDEGLVEGIKGQFIAPYQPRRLQVVEDIVEGEEVPS